MIWFLKWGRTGVSAPAARLKLGLGVEERAWAAPADIDSSSFSQRSPSAPCIDCVESQVQILGLAQHVLFALARLKILVLALHYKRVMARRGSSMATANQKLTVSLNALQELPKDGRHVFQATELSRVHRDRTGF